MAQIWLYKVWFAFASFITGIYSVAFPDKLYDSMTAVFLYVFAWNDIFPVTTVVKCLVAIMGFELVMFFGRLIVGIFALVRGSGKPEL